MPFLAMMLCKDGKKTCEALPDGGGVCLENSRVLMGFECICFLATLLYQVPMLQMRLTKLNVSKYSKHWSLRVYINYTNLEYFEGFPKPSKTYTYLC